MSTDQASAAPVLLRVSERVTGGEVLTFYGEGFDPTASANTVILEPLTAQGLPASPGPNARSTEVIQADPEGHFVRVLLPDAGPVAAWVTTSTGTTAAVAVNLADPRWLGVDQAYPGMAVHLIGRNLEAAGYGARGTTELRLVDRSGGRPPQPAPVVEVSSYRVVFTTPAVPPGSYDVEVRTSPTTPWIRLQNDPLTVVALTPTVDVLGLGVAWTADFAWGNRHDVTGYGAVGDGSTDDTGAIQAGIDNLADQGGGVLYFPSGTYNYSALQLQAGVILEGASNHDTVMQYTGTGGAAFTSTGSGITDGHGGIHDLRFTIQSPENLTSQVNFFSIGAPFSHTVLPSPGSGRFFMYRTVIDAPEDVQFVGLAFAAGFDQHVLVAENTWTGTQTTFYSPFINAYLIVRDNVFNCSHGPTLMARKSLILRNTQTTHFIEGFTTVSGSAGFNCTTGGSVDPPIHMYFQKNTVSGVGSHDNDGETYAIQDSGGTWFGGAVQSATSTTATVSIDNNNATGYGGEFGWNWQIVIVAGRGLGQVRDIIANSAGNTVLTIDRPWDIIPDNTSSYTVTRVIADVVCEDNLTLNSDNAFELYECCMDNVCAGMTSTNTEGISIWARGLAGGVNPFEPSYFNVVRDCTVTGESAFRQDTTFVLVGQQGGPLGPAVAVAAYGNEFRSNTINRSACSDSFSSFRNSPSGFEVSIGNAGGSGVTGGQFVLATLLEDSQISNSEIGIYLNTGVDSTLIHRATYTNVTEALSDSGSTDTLVID